MKFDLFIDTGPFYARYDKSDSYRSQAVPLWDTMNRKKFNCLTTNFVLSELITTAVYQLGSMAATRMAREIYNSKLIHILSVTPELELKALDWIERFSDQNFSMTDAVSFAVMTEQKIKLSFTFDSHFEIAGFQQFRQG